VKWKEYAFVKRIKWMLLIGLVILGGCQMEEYPDTKAFQDEFTREFLVSTEEEEEGYYLFESGTGGYQVLYPENAVVSEVSYHKDGDGYESITFEDYSLENNFYFKHDLTFSLFGERWLEENLGSLSTKVGYEGDYKEIKKNGNKIYYAQDEEVFESDGKKSTVYWTFSYILPASGDFGLEYIFSASCYEDSKDCTIDPNEQTVNALKLMESVQFLK
ncbi:hypothetical protein, partial [Gracilibacillus saliphilus]|uniref:hypothetical protein n=1 Tax=Gracilibacillus saliphilus TaxID=543890 RepID=UPI001EE309DB